MLKLIFSKIIDVVGRKACRLGVYLGHAGLRKKLKMRSIKQLFEEQELVVGLMSQHICNPWLAKLYHDAGADFLWKDMDSHEAAPVSLESVFSRAMNADFWINSGSALSLEDILKTEARLIKLGPFKKSTIYNNTAQLNPSGGNDFWETGVMEPQLILADLINIFHPGLIPGHKMKYYEQLH